MAEKRTTESWIIRTPPGMKDELTELAKRQGTNRNALVVDRLQTLRAEPDVPAPATNGESPANCRHPDNKLRRFAYGTFCGVCRVRVR